MKEQEFLLENYNSFNLRDIFECGQCFRWNIEEDGSYTGVFGGNVLNVKKQNNAILFKGICEGDIIPTIIDYFDLERDYELIKSKLERVDNNMKESIKYGTGIRILNQDLWETIISFIISILSVKIIFPSFCIISVFSFILISLNLCIRLFIAKKFITANNIVTINSVINVFWNFFLIILITPNTIVNMNNTILIKIAIIVNIPDTPNITISIIQIPLIL